MNDLVQLVTHSKIPNLNSGLVPIDPVGKYPIQWVQKLFIFYGLLNIKCKKAFLLGHPVDTD